MGKKHMGFKAAAASVAKKEGLPMNRANAIIAAGARKASPAAVKANPRLKKVAGVEKPERGETKKHEASETALMEKMERRMAGRDKK